MKNIVIVLRIFSSLATAVIAFILPLRLIITPSSQFFSFLYSIATIVLAIDFMYNLIEYRSRLNQQDESDILEQQHGYFFLTIDFIGALPLGLFSISPFIMIIQLLKIVRIAQYQSFWNKRAIRFGDYQKLVFFAFWMMNVTHWLACGSMALHRYPEVSDNITRYIKSLYWTVVTLTTVGYGDIVPNNNYEIIYSMVVMIFGVGIYGYVIGNIANILSSKDPAKIAFQNNIDNLKAFVKYRDLPAQLQNRIRDYYAYLWKKRLGYDETVFLKNLPDGLKHAVELHLKREIVDRIPLFIDTTEDFLNSIASHLKAVIYTPGDMVITEGEEGHEMFLVIKGQLKVFKNANPDQEFIIKEGDFFGEIALLHNEPRNANVQAITFADLYKLERKVFEFVLAQHPNLAKKIRATADSRLKIIK